MTLVKERRKEPKKIKPKKCKVPSCRASFTPFRPLQVVCSPECARKWADIVREKNNTAQRRKERKELREAKEKRKGKPELTEDAKNACNAYIRYRDRNEPCISCGKFSISGYYDAGHYRAVSLVPALRFHPDNIHKQCVHCNQHLHANLTQYRIRLIEKIGLERVLFLEQNHPLPHFTQEDLRQIIAQYKQLLKEEKQREKSLHK